MKKPQVLTINIGTGIGYSVLDIVKAFEKASNKKILYKVVGRREGDVDICYADSSFAKEKLGWEAKYTLDDMCQDSWNYKLNNL